MLPFAAEPTQGSRQAIGSIGGGGAMCYQEPWPYLSSVISFLRSCYLIHKHPSCQKRSSRDACWLVVCLLRGPVPLCLLVLGVHGRCREVIMMAVSGSVRPVLSVLSRLREFSRQDKIMNISLDGHSKPGPPALNHLFLGQSTPRQHRFKYSWSFSPALLPLPLPLEACDLG